MADYITKDDAREAVWEILNGMGYSQECNEELVEEVEAVIECIPSACIKWPYCPVCGAEVKDEAERTGKA